MDSERIRDEFLRKHGDISRSVSTVADLIAGFGIFLDFVKTIDVLSISASFALADRLRSALVENLSSKRPSDEFERWIELLKECLSSGSLYLRPSDSRLDHRGNVIPFETPGRGECVGWYDKRAERVYLMPETCQAAISKLAVAGGEPFLFKSRTVFKRLAEKGFLVEPAKQVDQFVNHNWNSC